MNISRNDAKRNCALPDRMQREHKSTPVTSLPKRYNWNLIMRKQINPNLGTFYKMTSLQSIKEPRVAKVKERLRNCSREILQLKVTHDFELNHYETLGQSVKYEWRLRSRWELY